MLAYENLKHQLKTDQKTWLITGVAGFIGSNLLESLLILNQRVIGLDNFSTGFQRNLNEVRCLVNCQQWENFKFIHGDICNIDSCVQACQGVDFVLHQAALGSVPRSINDPIATNNSNISGFLNMLIAARDATVKTFVFASSSSVYGDHQSLPKTEKNIGSQLSPYAVTKYVNELYASQFATHYGLKFIGLRYFNVFGRRQNPEGAYAAVIPKWITAMINNNPVNINGNGETSRDFCYIENVIQANLLAATTQNMQAINKIYNVAVNTSTTLNKLFIMLKAGLEPHYTHLKEFEPTYGDFRPGDVMHSQANIDKANALLGYAPTDTVQQGLEKALAWYVKHC